MKFSKWIKHSFEGQDNKASSRKLTTFVGMLMFITTWFCDLFFNFTVDQIMLICIVCIVLLGAGYMTAQNIVDILKRPQSSYYDNEIYNPNGRQTEESHSEE